MTLLRAHLVAHTLGELTDREFAIIGEVDLALKEPQKECSLLNAKVAKTYDKPVRA
jgi:hypothetical protein